MKNKLIILGYLYLICLLAGCGPQVDHPIYTKKSTSADYITIATGGAYGPYFTIGSALADIFSTDLDLNATVQTTGGSVENLLLLEKEKADIAFVMSDVALSAYEGSGNFKTKYKALRVMAGLYTNYVQIITLKSSGINTVNDLAGKKVSMGAPNSGVEVNAKMVLKGYGLDNQDFEPYLLSYHESMEQLRIGQIDAAFVTSGIPNSPVVELAKQQEVTIVPIVLEEMNKDVLSSYFIATEIPAQTYGNDESVQTIGIQNLLLARKNLTGDTVYELLATLYENIDELQAAHNAMQQVSSADIAPNLPIPLHDGAKRYFNRIK